MRAEVVNSAAAYSAVVLPRVVDSDEKRLRKYGKRFFKITESRLKWKVIRQKGLKAALELKQRKEGGKHLSTHGSRRS